MTHKYGWVPSRPDIRDHVYAAPHSVLAALPPFIDLSTPSVATPFDPVWNQGELGSCGPHTACADIVFSALRQQGLVNCAMPSRLFTYYVTRALMGTVGSDSGVSNRDMLKGLAQYGWCDETLWPYDISKFKAKPTATCFNQAKTRKISQYLAVRQDLDQMKGCLAGGDPFIFGFSVYESLETEEVSRTGVIPIPKRGERQKGGHDVLIVGYDDVTRKFKLRNSWGFKWGVNGYGWVPYEYALNPQLAGDFWTVQHSALPEPTPPPTPGPTPTGKHTIIITGGAVEVDGVLL